MSVKLFENVEVGERIDKYLATQLSEQSRTEIKDLIISGNILVNDKEVKANYRLAKEDTISVNIPEEEPFELLGEDLPLDILYEDDDIAVVIKPKGMVVHPGLGNETHTLANALLFHFDYLSDLNGEFRPGIVHRHDKDTSGVLVIAKTNEAHENLAEQFKAHRPNRHYMALVHDDIPNENGEIDVPIGRDPNNRKRFAASSDGKNALTRFKVKEHFKDYALVDAALYTGRTHQIRVHLKYINHPIVGDVTYGLTRPIDRQTPMCLFAYKLGFNHPINNEYMEFEAPLPEFFEKAINDIKTI